MSIETFFRVFHVKPVADELRRKKIVDIPLYPLMKRPSMHPKNSFLTRAFLGSIHHFFEIEFSQEGIFFLDHIQFEIHEGDILSGHPVSLGLVWTLQRIEEEVGPLTEPSDPAEIDKLKKISPAEQVAIMKKVNELVLYQAVHIPDSGGKWQVILA